jgi:hypothetical protein
MLTKTQSTKLNFTGEKIYVGFDSCEKVLNDVSL